MSPQEAMRMFRAEIGLSQTELAEKLNIGFSTLSRWENGWTVPGRSNANNIIRTAREMGVSKNCLKYLSNVLLPSRMRGRPASKMGFPELDQELLCQMVDGSAAGVIVIDEKTKQIIYLNRRAEELAGASFFDAEDKRCWSYLKGLDKPCADCDGSRYPLNGFCEGFDTTPDGRILRNRTRSYIWKGKKIYVVYMADVTELAESQKEVQRLTSLFPAGAGVFYVYNDGHFKMIDAYYHQLGEHGAAQKFEGVGSLGEIGRGDMELLKAETKAAIAENRDINILVRGKEKGHWIQLFARQFAKDAEKRMFFCSFVDVDRHMREKQTPDSEQP